MCGLTGVFSDTTVGTVCSSASGRSAVDLCVTDVKSFRIQSLGFGVGNGVLDYVLVHGSSLDWPATLGTRSLALLGLCLTSNTSSVFDERDDGLESKNIVKNLEALLDVHSLCEVSNLTAVLEVHSKVRSSRFGGLFRDLGFYTVTGHFYEWMLAKKDKMLKSESTGQKSDVLGRAEHGKSRLTQRRCTPGSRLYSGIA